MNGKDFTEKEEIFSKVLRAGRRTYFFDVRATKADDYYLTITESKKHEDNHGNSYYKKHKIYLYKEDFENFNSILSEVTDFILESKGKEVISETHNPNFKRIKEEEGQSVEEEKPVNAAQDFTNVEFDDI
ncbi:MAG: PUR family DNA/RNA-binding protein [Schleiferiaceae bacterium]|jgi:hypothetical protein|nr:PUR family DNA/RNA-binding protein [Schleiferiaceae bacterium]